VLPALAESALDEDMTDVIDTRAATHRGDRRPAARPAVPIGPLAVDPAPADRHPGRGSRRRLRRAARRPALDLGQGTGRAAAIGAAVTLLLTGVALLLGWTLGSGGLGVGGVAVVPDLDGLAREAAEERLTAAGFTAAVTARHDELRTEGTVVASSPAAGEPAGRGAPVELTVSAGPAPVPVPDLTGVVIRQAHGVARDARFTVEVAERRTDPAVPAGAVIEQHPAPGEQATPGTAVRVVLSEGRAMRPVPDMTGQDPETAHTTLADEGWDARVHRLPLPLSARGESRVLHQSPAAGTALPEGTAVHVWVG
jgi:serine/threonine-protein kinase